MNMEMPKQNKEYKDPNQLEMDLDQLEEQEIAHERAEILNKIKSKFPDFDQTNLFLKDKEWRVVRMKSDLSVDEWMKEREIDDLYNSANDNKERKDLR